MKDRSEYFKKYRKENKERSNEKQRERRNCNSIRGNILTVEETKIAIEAVIKHRKEKDEACNLVDSK